MSAFCQHCGQPIPANARFCQHCGQGQPATAASPVAAAADTGPLTPVANYSVAPPRITATYGGFWVRFVAVIIDAIVIGLITAPLAIMFVVAGIVESRGADPFAPDHLVVRSSLLALRFCISVAAGLIYEAAMLSSSRQATLGKMVFRLRVTDLAGQRLTFLHAAGRHMAKFISALTLFIGYIIAAFTERKQALHDLIAGTLVIQEQSVAPYPIVPQQPAV